MFHDTHVIQNPDINVGPGYYKELARDQLLITSVFYTHQGEGPFAGYPAVFVRLAGCNRGRKEDMGCRFCDTAFQYSNGKVMSFGVLDLEMSNTLVGSNTSRKPLVVITGGEPMMQNNLAAFCWFLQGQGWPAIQIESNGDRLVDNLPSSPYVTLVVSPKVSRGKDGYDYKEPNPDVFDRADHFKFLIETEAGSPYNRTPGWADTCGRPVYLSPITHYVRPVMPGEQALAWNFRLVDSARTRANYTFAAACAARQGFRLSMQQHLFFGVP